GQDAAAVWCGRRSRAGDDREPIAVAVVCDGCSSGASSEVGARLGAMTFARSIAAQLRAGASPTDRSIWELARAEVGLVIRALASEIVGDRSEVAGDCSMAPTWAGLAGEHGIDARDLVLDDIDPSVVHDHFLFTIVATAFAGDEAAVWALGDGAYV